jgi:hypothetical protein
MVATIGKMYGWNRLYALRIGAMLMVIIAFILCVFL